MSQFKINPDQPDEPTMQIEAYTYTGEKDFTDTEDYPRVSTEGLTLFAVLGLTKAYALRTVRGTKTVYYVKRGRYGRLYNPIGLYSEGRASAQMRHAGRPEWQFTKCSEKVFTNYINFLRSRNPAWLNNAEREV